jgi:hypothetical protein
LLDAIDADATNVLIGELAPLERWARHEVDLPETYPTGV